MFEVFKQIDFENTEKHIINFLRNKVRNHKVIFGLSGGLDSSTLAALLAKAFEKERILALIMPDSYVTPKEDIDDAMTIANMYNIKTKNIEIKDFVELFLRKLGRANLVTEGNLRARIRMIILYYFANAENRIVIGSGDRSELAIGYFTKYGDGGVDLLPIGYLYKTQVKLLANYLGIPKKIIEKESSPRLWPGQTAREELGMGYDEIDIILYYYLDLKYKVDDIIRITGIEENKVKKIVNMVIRNKHKLRKPPIAKIPYEVLFGSIKRT
ncbi:MAG: NAD+ synthase [Candidatus Verstraetearchaeota archaeon]|nr:NAD+ synthase [Candidatus Verstraetearchaeota archaeon]